MEVFWIGCDAYSCFAGHQIRLWTQELVDFISCLHISYIYLRRWHETMSVCQQNNWGMANLSIMDMSLYHKECLLLVRYLPVFTHKLSWLSSCSSSSSYHHLLPSTNGLFVTFSQLPCWQSPHALLHSMPCFLHVHLHELRASEQLQCSTGNCWAFFITGTSLLSSIPHPYSDGSSAWLLPIHSVTW